MLNASKGPAVRGPRAQMDRKLYKQNMQQLLAAMPGLQTVDGAVTNVLLDSKAGQNSPTGLGPTDKAIAGVMLASGELIYCIQGHSITALHLCIAEHLAMKRCMISIHQECFVGHFLHSSLPCKALYSLRQACASLWAQQCCQ